MSFRDLLDIFRFDPDGDKAVVVQNIPDGVSTESLENYLEVICQTQVKDIHIPPSTHGVAVAVFETSVKDIGERQNTRRNVKLEGVVPELKLMGRPKGIYFQLEDPNVSEEYLELYFENRKSGGVEETVEEAKIEQSGRIRHAVVKIKLDTAIQSILSKRDHQFKGKSLQLQPYYPDVHDLIIQKPWSEVKLSHQSARIASEDEQKLSQRYDFHVQRENADSNICINKEDAFKPSEPRIFQPEVSACFVDRPARVCGSLQVLYDDEEEVQVSALKHDTRNVSHTHFEHDVNYRSFPTSKTSVKAKRPGQRRSRRRGKPTKPQQRDADRQTPAEDTERNPGQKSSKYNKRDRNIQKPPELDEHLLHMEEISLPAVKITMLRIFHFSDKHQTDSLKFILRERDGKVIIKGATRENCMQGALSVHQSIDGLKSREEKLSNSRFMLLNKDKSQKCLRTRCIKHKVRAAFDVDDDRQSISWYGFTEEDINQGYELLKKEISVQVVYLKQGQEQILHGDAWELLKNELDIGLSNIFVDERNNIIVIESFLEEKATDINNRIENFLKENVPKKHVQVTFDGAKARYFQAHMKSRISQLAAIRKGKFDEAVLSGSTLKIQVTVEGDESFTGECNKVFNQIWHERLDFGHISSNAEDKWLMLQGLSGPTGQQLFRTFEVNHSCYIDVVKRGNFSIKQSKSLGGIDADEKNVVFDNKIDSDDGDEVEPAISSRSSRRPAYTRGLFAQGVMVEEDEAVQKAIEESLKSKESYPRRYSSEDMLYNKSPQMKKTLGEEVTKSETMTVHFGRTKVVLKKGILVQEQADALVNVTSPTGTLAESVIAKAFVESGGPSLAMMYELEKIQAKDPGTLVKTRASGSLLCSAVLHVRLQKGVTACKQVLSVVMQAVLSECSNNGYSTLALPPLGVGRMYRYPAKDVAEQILSEISTHSGSLGIRGNSLSQVTVVIFQDDNSTYQEFEAIFASFTSRGLQRALSVPVPSYSSNQLHQANTATQAYKSRLMQLFGFQKHPPSQLPAEPTVGLRNIVSAPGEMTAGRSRTRVETRITTPVQKMARKSRFPDDPPVPDINVVVFAENKGMCLKAKDALEKAVKKEFLSEETLKKSKKISSATKDRIAKIIVRHGIKSFKVKDGYVLRGQKEKVNLAHKEILKDILEEKESSVPKRKKRKNAPRGTKEFAAIMFEEEPELPSYWKNFKEDTSIKATLTTFRQKFSGRNFVKVIIPDGRKEYEAVIKMINSTFDRTKVGQGRDAMGILVYSKIHVLKIQRIENIELFEKFARQRQSMFGRLASAKTGRFPRVASLPKCTGEIETTKFVNSALDVDFHTELNEVLLFHGTKRENVKVICNSGFEQRLASDNAMFGQGIYGAECSLKADQYADSKTNRTQDRKKMFLVRMLLGNAYLCSDPSPHKFRKPPCTTCYRDDCKDTNHAALGQFGHFFDSVIGDNQKLFREFVVYDSTLCYPEYLVTYERR